MTWSGGSTTIFINWFLLLFIGHESMIDILDYVPIRSRIFLFPFHYGFFYPFQSTYAKTVLLNFLNRSESNHSTNKQLVNSYWCMCQKKNRIGASFWNNTLLNKAITCVMWVINTIWSSILVYDGLETKSNLNIFSAVWV